MAECAPDSRAARDWNISRIGLTQDLSARLIRQVSEGCGRSECRHKLCYTGRSNQATEPIRRPTATSARGLAISMLLTTHPRKALCNLRGSPRPHDQPDDDTPRDPYCLLQQVSSTKSIRAITNLGSEVVPSISDERLKMLHLAAIYTLAVRQVLQPPFELNGKRNPDYLPTRQAGETLLYAIDVITRPDVLVALELKPDEEGRESLQALLQTLGPQYDWAQRQQPTQLKNDRVTSLLDKLRTHPLLTLACTIFQGISVRLQMIDVLNGVNIEQEEQLPLIQYLGTNFRRATTTGDGHLMNLLYGMWSSYVWTQSWDGSAVVRRGTAACGVMEAIYLVHRDTVQSFLSSPLATLRRRDPTGSELIKSFVAHESANPLQAVHILRVPQFSWGPWQQQLFRGLTFLLMREAQVASMAAGALYREFVGPGEILHGANSPVTANFLVLKIRRNHALEDALDQIRDRTSTELLKPLRVLLEELDGIAMGQDLGGIQVEFFNIIWTQILCDETGLFESNQRGDMSYIKRGSLHPLQVYEHIGTLLALALYNGTPVPIALPQAFYLQLLGRPTPLHAHRDFWATECSSLERLMTEDVTEWGLEFSYSFEANGLLITVSKSTTPNFSDAKNPGDVVMHTADVYGVASTKQLATQVGSSGDQGPADDVEADTIDWPGLRVSIGAPDHILEVTQDNKDDYRQWYSLLLSRAGVQAQMNALKKGFHKVLSPYHLSLLSVTWLKAMLEGSSEIDMAEIRKATAYEGYEDDEPYIQTFWQVLEQWPQERKQAFVRFVTAAERLPVVSGKMLTFNIHRTTTDPQQPRLPTTSTCFGTLFLPQYQSTEIMEKMLITAVDLGEFGFGIS